MGDLSNVINFFRSLSIIPKHRNEIEKIVTSGNFKNWLQDQKAAISTKQVVTKKSQGGLGERAEKMAEENNLS